MCQHTKLLWRNLKEIVYYTNKKEKTVIFGANPPSDVLNCIILYTKAYIYQIGSVLVLYSICYVIQNQ